MRRRSLQALRVIAAYGALCCVVLAGLAQPATAATVLRIPPTQATVAITSAHQVRATITGRGIGSITSTRPITGGRTVVPVIGETTDPLGRPWLRIRMPGRAMGAATPPAVGWILAAGTVRTSTPLHIVVLTRSRQVLLYRYGVKVRSFRAVVGHPSTPTPLGAFFVEENVQLSASHASAPYALATSARSRVLHEFAGGPGQIAIHGRKNVGGALGSAVSHGCVRLEDAAVTWLARYATPGVPITIR
ncbi:MAG: ErfK/YbiS/YcfS/YnhG family protein [Thermoleophilia bacterium]|nr:ErfK/YbiS/YcfS/YnhG family protein [Thermoleophilia bacterium]